MNKSPSPVRYSRINQAKLEEEEKEWKTGKTEARRQMERKAAQQNKTSANPRVLRHEENCDYTLIKLIQAEEQKFK